MRKLTVIIMSLYLQGCAVLYKVQVSELDNTAQQTEFIDIKLSETGVNLEQIGKLADSLFDSQKEQEGGKIANIIKMIQMGPRTGNPVYNKNYARMIRKIVLKKCPSGKLTGLMSIRESADYNIVSGEIVRIAGWCTHKQ